MPSQESACSPCSRDVPIACYVGRERRSWPCRLRPRRSRTTSGPRAARAAGTGLPATRLPTTWSKFSVSRCQSQHPLVCYCPAQEAASSLCSRDVPRAQAVCRSSLSRLSYLCLCSCPIASEPRAASTAATPRSAIGEPTRAGGFSPSDCQSRRPVVHYCPVQRTASSLCLPNVPRAWSVGRSSHFWPVSGVRPANPLLQVRVLPGICCTKSAGTVSSF